MESTKLSSFRESETILYQKTTLIPLYDKRAIISHSKFPIKEIPTAQNANRDPISSSSALSLCSPQFLDGC